MARLIGRKDYSDAEQHDHDGEDRTLPAVAERVLRPGRAPAPLARSAREPGCRSAMECTDSASIELIWVNKKARNSVVSIARLASNAAAMGLAPPSPDTGAIL